MGNFYVNFTIRGVTQHAAAEALSGRRAIVSPPVNGAVVVFDSRSDEQDEGVIRDLASQLSKKLGAAVLAVMNHDDDIFWYELYESGKRIDEYNSSPGYFDWDGEGEMPGPAGGDAKALCRVFGCKDAAAVETILRKSGEDGYVFAVQRHGDLVEALGLPGFAVGVSYEGFDENMAEGFAEGEVVRTG
ncbi:MAG TPA: hypothetical protein VFE58_17980 [Tepidisphaeraceae bacterium]|jgi:hypothetical protein|nr:hypothetical protein [Tepidisphaeraceae bacterium]